ncbi:MAG: aldo/keto reductase [Candidatus Heimdallarchaeaceae archaeon]|nr:MAG: aldo/keto reductase [Candidatus Pacearchaeota archaeon]
MEYKRLGSTGIKISPLVLGTMQFGWRVEKEESFAIMDKALELGINCFDTADIYSYWADNSYPGKTEEIIGEWLKDRAVREDLILASKVRGAMSKDINDQGLSRRHIWQAINGSLKRLQTEWIDLYQIHSFDNDTKIEETLHALNLLVEKGLVNYIGASNIHPWMLVESFWVSEKNGYVRFETVQPPYSIVRRMLVEHQMYHVIKKYNLGVISYSPLAGGFLSGKYSRNAPLPESPRSESVKKRYFTVHRLKVLDTVEEIAENKEVTVAQVALAWILTKDFITAPIIGVNSVEQLESNLVALEIKFDQDELKRLDEVSDWIPAYEAIR